MISEQDILRLLPTAAEKDFLERLTSLAKRTVDGARDETEGALKDLLDNLEVLGLITDSTAAS